MTTTGMITIMGIRIECVGCVQRDGSWDTQVTKKAQRAQR